MITDDVGRYNSDKTEKRIGMALVKFAKEAETVSAEFQIGLLNQIVDGLGRAVTQSGRGSQHYRRNQAVESTDKLLPCAGLT